MIEKLKKLGLTGYEAQAFISLLKLGDAEANEIAINAKVPMGRIYNVLSSLEEAHLIRAQGTRPRRYTCVEPSVAMERLSKSKREELKHAALDIEMLASDIASELSDMKAQKPAKTFWTVAIGEGCPELVRECILGSKKELLFFMASRMTSNRFLNEIMKEKQSIMISALHDALKRGVEVKVILNKDVDFSALEDLPDIKKLIMYLGKEFNCRLAAIPATPFDIIDRETVILKMQDPINPGEIFAAVNLRDMKLAEELQKKFFTIWEKAEIYSGKNANCCN